MQRFFARLFSRSSRTQPIKKDRSFRWRLFGGLVIGTGMFYLAPTLYYLTLYAYSRIFHSNLHEVSPGRFYRSAQMPYEELQQTLTTYGIKTVIDLRKSWDEGHGGVNEETIVTSNGAKYVRVRLGSRDIPTSDRLDRLADILQHASEPILVHCSDGTHRTGFVSFLWLLEVAHRPVEEAVQQLSAKYGYSGIEQWVKSHLLHKKFLGALVWDYAEDYRKSPSDFLTWAKPRVDPQARETVVMGNIEESGRVEGDTPDEY